MDLEIDRRTKALTGRAVTGLAALAQRVWLRCSRLYGEWFLDLESGLPAELVGSKLPIELLRARVRAEIMGVSGVLDVPVLTFTLDAATRQFRITFQVRGLEGLAEGTL